ncbi:MAG TPA: oligosaccharide flippase family protein [Candidatus Binatia bacterium]|nr:oligosaccharide flippase family protein [Candidatus Binatia bacterium]
MRRNFVFLAASNMLAPFFSMVLVLAISRLRGVEELGRYSLLMTVFIVGQTIAGFGLPVIVTRDVAQAHGRAGAYFVGASLVSLLLVVPLLLVGEPALVRWVTGAEMGPALFVVLLTLVPSSITQAGEAVLLAFERAPDFVMINLAETTARACVGCAVVLAGHGVVAIAVVILVLRTLAAAAFVVVLRWRGVRPALRPDRGLCRDLLREVPVVGAIPVVNSIYARADVFLLSSLSTWAEVGLYSAALRLVDLARTIPPAYARSLYPVLARLRGESEAEFAREARAALRIALLIVGPLCLGLFVLAHPLVVRLFGPQLAPATTVLRVLCWTLIPLGLAITLAQILFSADRQAIDLRVNVVATAASIGLNVLLIPRLGAVGAAVAVLVTTTLYAGLQYVWVAGNITRPRALGHLARLVAALAAASVAALVLREPLGEIGAALAAGGVFAAGLVASGLVTVEEIRRARAFVARRSRVPWAPEGTA